MNMNFTLEKLINYCKLIYGITKIPTRILDDNYEDIFLLPTVDALKRLRLSSPILERIKDYEKPNPFLDLDEKLFTYSCIAFYLNQKQYYLLLGPCFLEKTNAKDLYESTAFFRNLSINELQEITKYFPVVELPYMYTVIQLFYSLIFDEHIHSSDIIKQNMKDSVFEDIPILTEETLFERRESLEFHTPYSYELKQMEIVRSGDVNRLKEILEDTETGKPGILSKNPLRNEKNLLIAGITMITRAAIDGGVPEETAYAMSDSFIQKSEECFDIKSICTLRNKVFYDFTLQVAFTKKQKRFSNPIEISLDYIHKHLHHDISLAILSEIAHLSVSQLSRNFRKEVGISIVDYVQKERIKASKNLLCFSNYSLLEISNYLNFGTQSYFIEIFKKHEGMTPAQFRKMYKNADFSE